MKNFKFEVPALTPEFFYKNVGFQNEDESSRISISETSAPSSTSEEQSVSLFNKKRFLS